MDRHKLKCNVATALSDMGLLAKLPPGRTDALVDALDGAPEEFRELSRTGVGPAKGTARWRACRSWALTMSVPTPRGRKPRAARVRQTSYGRVTFNEFGEIRFRAALKRELRAAAEDFRRDHPDVEVGLSEYRDLAEGMLALEGVPRGTLLYDVALEHAADICGG